jgi:hypothetical protein
VALLKEKRRANLKKERARNYKVILNVLIAVNKGITPETAIRS